MIPPEVAPVLILTPLYPPAWADVFGEDDAGVFAEFVLNEVRFVWRWIPPGSFLMGSPTEELGRWDDESPQHEVTMSRGFWMGETPVTQAQWCALRSVNPSHFKGDDRPVEEVDWNESRSFAAELNAAVPGLAAGLPTEAQWEYACRAGTVGAFHDDSPCTEPGGKDPALDRLGWFDENSGGETHAVKQKLANAWGLYDIHGNVWEWCADAKREYSSEPWVDPLHEADDSAFRAIRVVRGGSWYSQARLCRAAFRYVRPPGFRLSYQGFRLVAGLKVKAAEPGLRDEARR